MVDLRQFHVNKPRRTANIFRAWFLKQQDRRKKYEEKKIMLALKMLALA